jgi:hypothetical protein
VTPACAFCNAWGSDANPLTCGTCERCRTRFAIVRAVARRDARINVMRVPSWATPAERGEYQGAWLTARERVEAAKVAAVRGAA